MKKKNLKSLKLNKESVANLDKLKGGNRLEDGSAGSQNDSQCGYSCDPNLCTSVEPWGC
ncbi:hypothetical protein [uncultured Dokdonia sp.]|uniref:hypothetical protein n=1 Tax=uncultured Dokdonia sp. TaxID=575653 RepID=UPI002619C405|nr:hypothetical protein [uncultured Dokdonia sp.]